AHRRTPPVTASAGYATVRDRTARQRIAADGGPTTLCPAPYPCGCVSRSRPYHGVPAVSTATAATARGTSVQIGAKGRGEEDDGAMRSFRGRRLVPGGDRTGADREGIAVVRQVRLCRAEGRDRPAGPAGDPAPAAPHLLV